MYILKPILDYNWKKCGEADQKRIASQTPTPGIEQIVDIPYIDDGEKGHLLDIYYPEGTKTPLPVIIDIHGGGWMYGYKEINKYFCLKLASKGFCVASINYRLAGDVLFDDQIRDIFAALCWLSQNLKNYPADTKNVFLAGDSAGGHFACVTAAVNLSAELQGDFGVSYTGLDFKGIAAISPAVQLTGFNPVMNVNLPVLLGKNCRKSKYYKYMDVKNIASENLPPFYILTSTGDFIRSHSYKLADILKSHGVPYRMHDFEDKPGGKPLNHVFSVVNPYSEPGERANTEITDFFKALM